MIKKPRAPRNPRTRDAKSPERVRQKMRAEATENTLGRLLMPDGGNLSPFWNCRLGAQDRAFRGAQAAIDEAIRLVFMYVSHVGDDEAEEGTADFYLSIIEWVENMRRDNVDIGALLTRLRKHGGGNHAGNSPFNA